MIFCLTIVFLNIKIYKLVIFHVTVIFILFYFFGLIFHVKVYTIHPDCFSFSLQGRAQLMSYIRIIAKQRMDSSIVLV